MFSDAAEAFFKNLFVYVSTHKWAEKTFDAVYQAMIFAIVLAVFYTGFMITREGSFVEGIKSAYWDTNIDISRKHRAAEIAVAQAELHYISSSNKTIDQLMTIALEKIPTSSRIRLAEIHNGIAGLTNREMLRADITHAIARPGRATGDLSVGLSLGSLATYDEAMLGGQCWWNRTDNLPHNPGREHLERIGVEIFMSCPVMDPARRFLGALSIHWDRGDTLPANADIANITNVVMNTANSIGSSLASR